MSKFWHIVAQVGATVLQVANAAAPFVPPPYNAALAAGLGLVQVILAIYHHQPPPKVTVTK